MWMTIAMFVVKGLISLLSPGGKVREALFEAELRKRDLAAAAEAGRREAEVQRLQGEYERIAQFDVRRRNPAFPDVKPIAFLPPDQPNSGGV